MKKILSSALAAVLVLGMGVSAFAATVVKTGESVNVELEPFGTDIFGKTAEKTHTINAADKVTQKYQGAAPVAASDVKVKVTNENGATVATTAYNYDVNVVNVKGETVAVSVNVKFKKAGQYTIDAEAPALSAKEVLVEEVTTTGSEADGAVTSEAVVSTTPASGQVTDIVVTGADVNDNNGKDDDKTPAGKTTGEIKEQKIALVSDAKDEANIEAKAGDKIKIALTAKTFGINEDGKDAAVTASMIRKGKVQVRTKVAAGSNLFTTALKYEKVGDLGKTAVIEVKFVDPFVSTKEKDFDFNVYLSVKGDRYDDLGANLAGKVTFETTEVFGDDDYVDLSKGQVAEAIEYNKAIEVDLGEGVIVNTKMFAGKKYYGIAKRDNDEKDDAVLAAYADIDSVYTLYTVGLTGSNNTVEFKDLDDSFYVYTKNAEGNLVLLGKSNEKLPVTSKYYLANKELVDVDDADEEDIDTDEETIDGDSNPATGGDDASETVNYNPSTGR